MADEHIIVQAARRTHVGIVDLLRQVGANLGGTDVEGGFAALEVKKATQKGDEIALHTWTKAGYDTTSISNTATSL